MTVLHKDSFYIGNDFGGGDDGDLIVPFYTNIGTNNYLVAGSLVSYGNNWNDDNDVIWMVRNKTSTYFELLLRQVTNHYQVLRFDYAIIPF
jgi:hypothetical protein